MDVLADDSELFTGAGWASCVPYVRGTAPGGVGCGDSGAVGLHPWFRAVASADSHICQCWSPFLPLTHLTGSWDLAP